MPDTATGNFDLTLVGVGTSKDTWGDKLNANTVAIDALLKLLQDALVAKLDATGFTPASVLEKLKLGDGAGSGIDADLLDGKTAADFALTAAITPAAILAALLNVDANDSGLNASTLQGNTPDQFAAAQHSHAYLPTAGGQVTGDISRAGGGDYVHHANAVYASGAIFVTEAGASNPMTQPGQIWIKLAP